MSLWSISIDSHMLLKLIYKYMKRTNKSGFTIVELLVVIVIIGILAAITAVSYSGISGLAAKAAVSSHLSELAKNAELYNIENGYYPSVTSEISASKTNDQYFPVDNNFCIQTTAPNGKIYSRTNDSGEINEVSCTAIPPVYDAAPSYSYAPESCFEFNTATNAITNYYTNQSNNINNLACPLEITIPSAIGGVAVQRITDNGFYQSKIQSVVLNEGLVEITGSGFASSDLRYIHIPSTLTSLGADQFDNTKLESLYIPASVNNIGMSFLYGNEYIKTLSIALDATDSTPPLALGVMCSHCTSLKNLYIGKNVNAIRYSSFSFNNGQDSEPSPSQLKTLVILDGNIPLDIYSGAFTYAGFEKLILPGRTRSIESGTDHFPRLKELTIEPSIDSNIDLSLNSAAFQDCPLLEKVTLPGRTSLISGGSLSILPNLKELIIQEGNTELTISNGGFYTTGLTSINFPKQTRTIENAIGNNSSLSTVTFQKGLTTIGYRSFYNTAITNVSIPAETSVYNDPEDVESWPFNPSTIITRF